MRFAQLHRIKRSQRAITTRVLPDPVAITRSALRVVGFESLAHATDRASLIVSLHDRLADLRISQFPARHATLNEQLQLALLVESLHRPRGGCETSSHIQC